MTEAEWLDCTDPPRMLEFLSGRASDRKLRLFAVACVRRVSQLLVPEAVQALEVAERVAEGLADAAERRRAREAAFHAGWVSFGRHQRGRAKAAVCDTLARRAREATWASQRVAGIVALQTSRSFGGDQTAARHAQLASQASLLRCLFGNPLGAASASPAWLAWNDGTVRKLAQVIYDDRAFDRLPLLADALEDAGCTDAAILGHCRNGGEHVRGCWVVDALLGKS